MNKPIILLAILTLSLSACQSLSKQEIKALQEQAQQAEQLKSEKANLAAENDRLLTQELNLQELNRTLSSEINEKQVMIETLQSHPAPSSVKVTFLNAILFSSGEYRLNAQGRQAIAKMVPTIQQHLQQGGVIRIIGHTDDLPVNKRNDNYQDNWDLSSLRAADVARLLIWGHHLPFHAFRVEGHAAAEPKASNKTEEGRANNRRIEIILASE